MNYEPFTSIENPTLSAAADLAPCSPAGTTLDTLSLRDLAHSSLNSPLHLSRVLYKSNLFMQNKPNFQNSQMNVNPYNTTDYERKRNWTLGQNKPNSNPILKRMNVNFCAAWYYKSKPKALKKPPLVEFTIFRVSGHQEKIDLA